MFAATWWRASELISGGRGVYIVAMLLLCLHLYHGLWSMFQSLGIAHPRYTPMLQAWARRVVATLIAVGNISIPLAVLAGAGEIKMELNARVPLGDH